MAPVLLKRATNCYGYNCSNSWNWARWILFVLLILGLVGVILSAVRVNKRRGQEGRQPIRGTAWITPPSYMQSQTQNPPFVPQYTETANDNDAGYYDAEGTFHPNPKVKEAYHMSTLVPDQTGTGSSSANYAPPPGPPSGPPPAAVTTATGEDANVDFSRDFARYYSNSNNNNTDSNNNEGDIDNLQRPAGPPPAHLRN